MSCSGAMLFSCWLAGRSSDSERSRWNVLETFPSWIHSLEFILLNSVNSIQRLVIRRSSVIRSAPVGSRRRLGGEVLDSHSISAASKCARLPSVCHWYARLFAKWLGTINDYSLSSLIYRHNTFPSDTDTLLNKVCCFRKFFIDSKFREFHSLAYCFKQSIWFEEQFGEEQLEAESSLPVRDSQPANT